MTEVFYAAVKASLHASDSSVFGLRPEEYSALCRRFPDSNKQVINGILIKGSPLEVINSLAELGYRVTCTSGEAEIVWTLKREALPGEKSPVTSPQSTPPQVIGRPFVVQPSIPKVPVKQVERIGTKPEDWKEVEKIEERDKIYVKHVSSVERIDPGQKIILKTNLSSEFNPMSKRSGQRGGPFIALPVSKQKPPQNEQNSAVQLSPPSENLKSFSSGRSAEVPSEKMPHHMPHPSVAQNLDEMDFERGIWYPASQGDLNEVCKLLNKGVNVNVADKSGYTALHYAVRSGDMPIIKTLINAGADVNVKTKAGQATPLHRAAAAGHAEVVKFLLDHGANLIPVDNDGRTPLHRAAEAGHEAVALMLLKAAPQSLIIRDSKGQTPVELAKGSLATIIKGAALPTQQKTSSSHSSKRSSSKSPPPRSRSNSP